MSDCAVPYRNSRKEHQWEGIGYPSMTDDLHYQIDGRIFTFANSALVGIWMVIEKSRNKIILQAYRPEKSVATLTK